MSLKVVMAVFPQNTIFFETLCTQWQGRQAFVYLPMGKLLSLVWKLGDILFKTAAKVYSPHCTKPKLTPVLVWVSVRWRHCSCYRYRGGGSSYLLINTHWLLHCLALYLCFRLVLCIYSDIDRHFSSIEYSCNTDIKFWAMGAWEPRL